jgi:pyruvate dehydrogenase E1 component beta subunit
MQQALNQALRTSMRDDERILIFGEDVGRHGGVFRVTDKLQAEFGTSRVFDSPLAEAGIVGTAIGLSIYGYRPVVELQFDGFAAPAFDQIVSQMARYHARSRGAVSLPLVVRIPSYGGIKGPEHHSESVESHYANVAGLKIASAATAGDAYHLLVEAIRDPDPVLFLEPKARYWTREPVAQAESSAALPRYSARTLRAGEHATVIAWGASVSRCLHAAEFAAEDGVDLEVLDLRWIRPLDVDSIVESVRRTGRAVVVHEAPVSGGFGGEISAVLMEHCFDALKAPVVRVGAPDIPYPSAGLEDEYLPSVDRILSAVQQTFGS